VEFNNNKSQDPTDHGFDVIDTDAVCEECGAVSPEGTLFCKKCGNNLRDQRTRRLSLKTNESIEHLGMPAAEKGRRMLVGLLTAFALLLLLWAALPGNVGKIEDALIRKMSGTAVPENYSPNMFWNADLVDTELFEEMEAFIRENPISVTDLDKALNTLNDLEYFEGLYILREGGGAADPVVGMAYVIQEDNELAFAASLNGAEIRGFGSLGATRLPFADYAGVRVGRRYRGGDGYLVENEVGGFICVIEDALSQDIIRLFACKVPE